MKTVNAIKRAQTEHMNGGANINALRLACLQLLEVIDNPKAQKIGPEIQGLRDALKGVPEQRVDWEHHNNLRDAMIHAAAVGTYPEVVATLRAMSGAAENTLNAYMPQFTDSRAVDDCLVELAAASVKSRDLLKVIDSDVPPPAMEAPPAVKNLDAIDELLKGANEASPDA